YHRRRGGHMSHRGEDTVAEPQQDADKGSKDFRPNAVSSATMRGLEAVAGEVGGPYVPLPATEGAVGFTHFDTPASEDNAVIVLLAKDNMDRLPSQALVRIKSLKDDGAIDREYLGV